MEMSKRVESISECIHTAASKRLHTPTLLCGIMIPKARKVFLNQVAWNT
jgi:hypothetical protein